MKEEKPHCNCQLDCPHHRNERGGVCKERGTSWDDDPPLCSRCQYEEFKNLLAELPKVKKEIGEWKVAHAVQKIARGSDGDIEEEELKKLHEKRDRLEREVKEVKKKRGESLNQSVSSARADTRFCFATTAP